MEALQKQIHPVLARWQDVGPVVFVGDEDAVRGRQFFLKLQTEYEVAIFISIREARALLRRNDVDLVIMDGKAFGLLIRSEIRKERLEKQVQEQTKRMDSVYPELQTLNLEALRPFGSHSEDGNNLHTSS